MFSGIIKEIGFSTYAIFESIRVYQGKIFKLDAHLERFYESARTIMLELPRDKSRIKRQISRVVKASKFKDAYIRIDATGENKNNTKIRIVVKKIKKYPPAFYAKGVKVNTTAVRRDYINTLAPNIKSANFLNGVLAKIEINNKDIFEAILLNSKGHVVEGIVSNIFIVKNNCLITPPLFCGALGGITRSVVMNLAHDLLKVGVMEQIITRHDIYTADEVFLTNTILEIMPVVFCDGRLIANGKPGKTTRKLIAGFKNSISQNAA